MLIIFDQTSKLTKRITFESSNNKFRKFHLLESVITYLGHDTNSCVYLFNPMFDKPELDTTFDLVNITFI